MDGPSEILKGYGDDALVQRVGTCARVYNEEPIQLEIAQDDVHRFGGSGRVGVLELEPVSPPTSRNDQIQLGSGLSAIEERLPIRVRQPDDLFEGEPFP